jgi:hypothetical protein
VSFEIGSEMERQGSKEYLQSVVKLLKEKKELRLNICGTAVPGDFPEKDIEKNKEAFHGFADQRSNVIKDYFINQGIYHDRLFLCNPEVDMGEEASPMVKLSI